MDYENHAKSEVNATSNHKNYYCYSISWSFGIHLTYHEHSDWAKESHKEWAGLDVFIVYLLWYWSWKEKDYTSKARHHLILIDISRNVFDVKAQQEIAETYTRPCYYHHGQIKHYLLLFLDVSVLKHTLFLNELRLAEGFRFNLLI